MNDIAEYILDEAIQNGDELHLDLFYPRSEDNIKHFVIGLEDIRAAQSIRVSYDFERDGWKIEKATKFEWGVNDLVCDPEWKEVAFIKETSHES
jgi:hypothetical protein